MNANSDLCSGLRKAIEYHIQLIIEEEAQEAARRVEKKVRERSTAIAANVLQHFEIGMYDKKIRILIDFENTHP
jgi:hypothetical protein